MNKVSKIKARTKNALLLKEGNVLRAIKPDRNYALAEVRNGLLYCYNDKRTYSMAKLVNEGYTFEFARTVK